MKTTGIPFERSPEDAPEYLRPFATWTYEDFLREAREDGADEPRAKRLAEMYAWAIGERVYGSVLLDGDWTFHGRPWFADGGAVAFVTSRGRKHRAVDLKGRVVGPEQRDLAAMLAWLMSNGWVTL